MMDSENESPRIHKYSIEEALNIIGYGKFQVLLLLLTGTIGLADASELVLLPFLTYGVRHDILGANFSNLQLVLLSTCVFFGMFVGNYVCGIMSDRFGRRPSLLLALGFCSVFGLLSSTASSYIGLIIARTMVGFGVGAGPASMALYLEFLATSWRGAHAVLLGSFYTIGVLLETSLAWILLPSYGWRWLLFASAIPACIIFVLSFFFLPESPRFLLANNRHDEAITIIMTANRMNNNNHQLTKENVRLYIPRSYLNKSPPPLGIKKRNLEGKSEKGINWEILQLFSSRVDPNIPKLTILLCIISALMVFSFYSLVILTVSIVEGPQWININSVLSPSHYARIMLAGLADCIGLIITALAVDAIGRKPLSSIFFFVLFCSFLSLAITKHSDTVSQSIALYCARASIEGVTTTVWLLASEIYPTSLRTLGVGVASMSGRIGAATAPFVAQMLYATHPTLSILILSFISFFGCILVQFIPYETANRHLNDVVGGHNFQRLNVNSDYDDDYGFKDSSFPDTGIYERRSLIFSK